MENIVTIIVAIISSGVLNTLITYSISAHEKKKNADSGIQESLRLMMKEIHPGGCPKTSAKDCA